MSGPVPPVDGPVDQAGEVDQVPGTDPANEFRWGASTHPELEQLELVQVEHPDLPAGRARFRGTRVRAGNAMARTRASLLDAAVRLIADRGIRRTSMTDIAHAAGIAKGTLYNHFRNKDEVFAALVEAEVLLIADECRGLPLEDALAVAAIRLDTHPALRRVAAEDPAILAALSTGGTTNAAAHSELATGGTTNAAAHSELATGGTTNAAAHSELVGDRAEVAGRGWQAALSAAADALEASGRDPRAAELVVRWLVSHLTLPDQDDAQASARLLAAVLPLRTLATV